MSKGPQPFIVKPLKVVLDRDHRCPQCNAWLFWCEHYDTSDADNRLAPVFHEPDVWPWCMWIYGALETALVYRARALA